MSTGPSNVNREDLEEEPFDELFRKVKKQAVSDETNNIFDLYHQENKQAKQQKENILNALKVLLLFGKLRKNFLYFQCCDKEDERNVDDFIKGIEPISVNQLSLDKQNYPINK